MSADANATMNEETPLISEVAVEQEGPLWKRSLTRWLWDDQDDFSTSPTDRDATRSNTEQEDETSLLQTSAEQVLSWEDDDVRDMTFGRRLARRLSNYSWYNPKNDESSGDGGPSLDTAWAHFEHVTLARYVRLLMRSPRHKNKRDKFRKAEPGERSQPTNLYPLTTPEAELADFGIGVGIYFFTLRGLAIIMLLAALINLPSAVFYASDEYGGWSHKMSRLALEASAVCTQHTWVPCPTCTKHQWDGSAFVPSTHNRYAEATASDGSTMLSFIKLNDCNVTSRVGRVGYISLLFIVVATYILGKLTKLREEYLDQSAQTTSDYSVEVENPPTDARSAEEWREFFQQFGNVACCTVALDNEELIFALKKKRELWYKLVMLQPPGAPKVDIHNVEQAVQNVPPSTSWFQKLLWGDAVQIGKQIQTLEDEINSDLGKRRYDVSNIFITFKTERAQQRALKALSVRGIDVLRNNTSVLPEQLLFRGKYLISVVEPPEPDSVRWQDLDESKRTKLKQRAVTFLLTLIYISFGAIAITYTRYKQGIVYAAILVTAINSISPMYCKYITGLESHSSEGLFQASLYLKLTACLWILTAIVTAFNTPFVDTLSSDEGALIPAMYAIFITETLKAPVTQSLDIPGHVKRHILAPRARDQSRMNSYFQGTTYELSERYTDMTNVLFLTFNYGIIFPVGFLLAAVALYVHYWTDKFCLLRSWAPAPRLGTTIAEFSRQYFFTTAVAIYAIISSYNFASFPYDNACEDQSLVSPDYVGNFTAVDGEGNSVNVSVSSTDKNYFFCDQDLLRAWKFPPVPSRQPEAGGWMNEAQERQTLVYGWTAVVVLVAVAIVLINVSRKRIRNLLFNRYKPHDRVVVEEHFSDQGAYIPSVKIIGCSFPLLLCNTSDLDPELIGWEPDSFSYDANNAVFDVPGLDSSENGVFSIVRHW